MNVINRKAIKQEARDFIAIDRTWLNMFAAIVIYYLLDNSKRIISLIEQRKFIFNVNTVKYFFDIYKNAGDVEMSSLLNNVLFVIRLLIIPFEVALAGYFLNHLRGFKPDAKSLYREGIDNYINYFTAMFITGLSVFFWSLLLIVPGIIKMFEYSQVPYILHDNKDLKASQAKKISSLMTNGYKLDLFVLELSFIAWHFVASITCGLGYIYVLPYINTVKAMYYENLKNNVIEKGIVAPESFMMSAPEYNAFDNMTPPTQETNNFYNSRFVQDNFNQNADNYNSVPEENETNVSDNDENFFE